MEFTGFIQYRQIKAKLCYQTSYLSKSLDENVSFYEKVPKSFNEARKELKHGITIKKYIKLL